ncbi:hypothetical protein pb186bvf_014984 [Paramecium bursaria]
MNCRNQQLPKRYGYLNTNQKELMNDKRKIKFDLQIKQMKSLDTFIDLQPQIKDLNILQSGKIRMLVQHLKHQQLLKKSDGFTNTLKNNLKQIGDQLEIELDMLYQDFDEGKKIDLDLTKLKFDPSQVGQMIQESTAILNTHYSIHKLQEKIKKKSAPRLKGDEFLDSISKIDFLTPRNTDTQDFYRGVLKTTHFTQQKQQKEDPLEIKRKYLILQEYLQNRGIQIEKQENVPGQQYLDNYLDRADRLIRWTKEQQVKKLKLNIPAKTQRNYKSEPNQPNQQNQQSQPRTSILDYRHSQRVFITKPTGRGSEEKFRDFITKTQALNQFYRQEEKDIREKIEFLDNEVDKPLQRHYDDFIEMKTDRRDIERSEQEDKMCRKKENQNKKLRMQKIFKSDFTQRYQPRKLACYEVILRETFIIPSSKVRVQTAQSNVYSSYQRKKGRQQNTFRIKTLQANYENQYNQLYRYMFNAHNLITLTGGL